MFIGVNGVTWGLVGCGNGLLVYLLNKEGVSEGFSEITCCSVGLMELLGV